MVPATEYLPKRKVSAPISLGRPPQADPANALQICHFVGFLTTAQLLFGFARQLTTARPNKAV